jgi:Skp family chaperone for outer membrane proteins
MKTVAVYLAMTVLPALAVGLAQPRPAQATGPVAYVSSQRISNETAMGRAGLARLQTMQRERSTDVRTKQQTLETTRRQLAAAQGDERVRLQAQEQQQRTEFERAVAQAQTDIQALQRQISAELSPQVKAAIEQIVKATGIQVVLNGDNTVVWANPALDLTSRVIEQLNTSSPAPPPAGQVP